MRHFLKLVFLILPFNHQAQESFTGKIKFVTKIEIDQNAPEDYKDLPEIYGDSLYMFYLKDGNFKRVHLNSADFGNGSQTFNAQTGKIYFKYKNQQIDSIDVTKNSLQLISKKQVDNEKILGKNCNCLEYETKDYEGEFAIVTYCYSNSSPKLNANHFSKHIDFFLYDFYKSANRPYLKFKLKTKNFTLSYVATELMKSNLDKHNIEME